MLILVTYIYLYIVLLLVWYMVHYLPNQTNVFTYDFHKDIKIKMAINV